MESRYLEPRWVAGYLWTWRFNYGFRFRFPDLRKCLNLSKGYEALVGDGSWGLFPFCQ